SDLPAAPCVFSVFSVPTCPSTRCTLFPYTTLFRSDVYFSRASGVEEPRHVFLQHNRIAERCAALPADGQGGAALGDPVELQENVDRKSTRLNSSHVKNSYAVFCLKKKNDTPSIAHH